MIDRTTRIIKKYLEYQKEIYSIFGLEEPKHEFDEFGYTDYHFINYMEGVPWKIVSTSQVDILIDNRWLDTPIYGSWEYGYKNISRTEKYTAILCAERNDGICEDTIILTILENRLEVKNDD